MADQPDLAQEAKAHLNDVSDTLKERVNAQATAKADAVRDTAADEAQSAADAAWAAAEQFDAGSLQAQAAHRIADQIEGVATQLRATDLNDLVAQTSDFARRNPLLFMGGAAALGFAATRFLKARTPSHAAAAGDHGDPWQSPVGARPADRPQDPEHRTVLSELNGGAHHG